MVVSYRKVGNRWHIRFIKGSGKNRKEVIKSLPGTLHEKSVQKKADWYDVEWHMGRYDPFREKQKNDKPLLGDAVDEYCLQNKLNGNWAESTYKTTYSRLSRLIDGHEEKQITEHTGKDYFESLVRQTNGKPVSRKGVAASTNAFITWLHQQAYIDNNFSVSISMHDQVEMRNDDKVKALYWDQLRDVCDAHRWRFAQDYRLFKVDSKYSADFYTDMWWFYFYSLLRATELPRLKVADLLTDGRLKVRGKGRRTDIIYLPPPALVIAEKYAFGKKPDEPLFTTHNNRSRQHFGKAVELAMGSRFANIHGRKGFHQLRHGGIVHYLSLGKPVQFVSKLARHKSISITTDTYGDVINEAARDAFSDITHRPATRPQVEQQKFPSMN